VVLYQQNWAGAEAAANSVIAMGYTLAPNYADLFTPEGQDTPEDIWRVEFTAQESNSIGFYYQSKTFGGRREEAPSAALRDAYEANDARKAWNIRVDPRGRRYGNKYPTAVGAEDLHVIRFAEVLLIKAEAQARQGKLTEAIATVNPIRVRAGLAPLVLGVTVIGTGNVLDTQQEVIDAILKERRLELAMEGDRFPDLVRTGRAVAVLNIADRPYQALFPIPQRELDVAPNLTQNPGY
jgi:hypothetical protein